MQAGLQHVRGARAQHTGEALEGAVAADDTLILEEGGQAGAEQPQQQQQHQQQSLHAGASARVPSSQVRHPEAAAFLPAGSPAADATCGALAVAEHFLSPQQQQEQQTVSEAQQQVAELVNTLDESPLSAAVRSPAPPASPCVLHGGAWQHAPLAAAAHQDIPAGTALTESAAAPGEPPSKVPALNAHLATQAGEGGPWEGAAAAVGLPATQGADLQEDAEELRAGAAGQGGLPPALPGTLSGW